MQVGDIVFAYWEPVSMYFIGTAVEYDNTQKGGAYLIIFADGDQKVIPQALIKPFNLSVGYKVIAKWKNGKYYPGTVNKIIGRAAYIHYDDGDKGWCPFSGIAIK